MKHFICEFITAGGMRAQPLPTSLVHEGRLMLETLAGDLTELRDVELSLTHDSRIEACGPNSRAIDADDNVWQIWERCLDECDYFWPIAPETNGELYRLTKLAQGRLCRVIGSTAAAVDVCSSKLRFASALADGNMPVITTCRLSDGIPSSNTGWVVKPDIGAGCERCYRFCDRRQVRQFQQSCERPSEYVVQPYIPGIAASLSVLVCDGEFMILACNRQNIEEKDGCLHLAGLEINAFGDRRNVYYPIVRQIIEMVSGLSGFVGVDMIITARETKIVELNPRITTAFFGLSRSLGENVGGMALNAFTNGCLPAVPSGTRPIRLGLSGRQSGI